jgi:hypothetical protein
MPECILEPQAATTRTLNAGKESYIIILILSFYVPV